MIWTEKTTTAVIWNPIWSTKTPVPARETKRPAPLRDDQIPATNPWVLGLSGYPACLMNKKPHLIGSILEQSNKTKLHCFSHSIDNTGNLLASKCHATQRQCDANHGKVSSYEEESKYFENICTESTKITDQLGRKEMGRAKIWTELQPMCWRRGTILPILDDRTSNPK